jgi:hypothetical protein
MSISLQHIKESIEDMSFYHQVEVLRLLHTHTEINFNENSNGSFINLSEQSQEVIQQLQEYVSYVREQEQQLQNGEDEKNQIAQTFFSPE